MSRKGKRRRRGAQENSKTDAPAREPVAGDPPSAPPTPTGRPPPVTPEQYAAVARAALLKAASKGDHKAVEKLGELLEAVDPGDPGEAGWIDLGPLIDGLTEQQVRFAFELLVDDCQTSAAKRAGYAEERARQTGYDLMRQPKVAALVDALRRNRARRLGITADHVLLQLWYEATQSDDARARVTALGQLQKAIAGAEAPRRHEHTGPGGAPIEHMHGVSEKAIDALVRGVLGFELDDEEVEGR